MKMTKMTKRRILSEARRPVRHRTQVWLHFVLADGKKNPPLDRVTAIFTRFFNLHSGEAPVAPALEKVDASHQAFQNATGHGVLLWFSDISGHEYYSQSIRCSTVGLSGIQVSGEIGSELMNSPDEPPLARSNIQLELASDWEWPAQEQALKAIAAELAKLGYRDITMEDVDRRAARVAAMKQLGVSPGSGVEAALASDIKRAIYAAARETGQLDLSDKPSLDLAAMIKGCRDPEKIRSLSLANNQLTSLPDGIARFIDLEELDISDNPLGELPPLIPTLLTLTSLFADDIALPRVPVELTNLLGLRKLFIRRNQIESLPDELVGVTLLRKIGITGNPLARNRKAISKLKKLLPVCVIE
jgi:hypothetical protein